MEAGRKMRRRRRRKEDGASLLVQSFQPQDQATLSAL